MENEGTKKKTSKSKWFHILCIRGTPWMTLCASSRLGENVVFASETRSKQSNASCDDDAARLGCLHCVALELSRERSRRCRQRRRRTKGRHGHKRGTERALLMMLVRPTRSSLSIYIYIYCLYMHKQSCWFSRYICLIISHMGTIRCESVFNWLGLWCKYRVVSNTETREN